MLQLFAAELAQALATVEQRTFDDAVLIAVNVRRMGGTVYFIGNGGSAAIASHMAIDWANKAGFDARDLNNPAALTCLANDYGYAGVFAHQLTSLLEDDLLVAISSSGNSENILRAVRKAVRAKAYVIALSGFKHNNKLQQLHAEARFHIPSDSYAIVENAHMAILHAMLEVLKG